MKLPAPTGTDWKAWAEDVRRAFARSGSKLDTLDATASAAQDGIVLFDRTAGAPVYSTGGAFVPFGGGGGVSNGDKGDITVSGGGATWTIDALAVTDAKIAGVAWGKLSGIPAPVSALSGTNTGDQTSIVGITGTKAQFDTAVTDGNFLYVGDVTSNATHTGEVTGSGALTITNGAVTLAKMADVATASVFYRKTTGTGAPEVQTLATLKTDLGLTGTNSGDQTTIAGITGTKAQFDTAVTDGNFLYVGDVTSNATHTGDVTGATALTIANDAVTYAKMQNAPSAGFIGATAAGDYAHRTPTEATAALDVFTTSLKGLAPSSGGGTSNFLRADGTWAAPSGGGGSTIYYGHLQADYTLTSSTAVQKLFNWSTNGALTLPTGIYRFRTLFYLTTMSATSGNGAFELRGSGTATLARIIYHVHGIDNNNPLAASTHTASGSVTQNSVAGMVTATTGTGLIAIIEGFFDVTVTGTIIPSIALVTANAAVVKAGSFFECERVGATATAASSGWT